jgi:arylsulfatase A
MRRMLFLFTLLLASPLQAERPNIIFILADDLGYGDLGSYGQSKIRTPNLDQLAKEGMRLTSHYSGNNVCAPSRCVLMTGMHPGHAFIRDNRQQPGAKEGQVAVPPNTLQLPLQLKSLGYQLGGFGKWGLGPVGSTGDPLKQGFDRFFGYNCQAVAHNYYPKQLWNNDQPFPLNNPAFPAHQKLMEGDDVTNPTTFAKFAGNDFAPDRIGKEAEKFVRDNASKPFFMFYPTTIPHLALQVPAESLKAYAGAFPEEIYRGDRGYLPHPTPRAAYAAMITHLDTQLGKLFELLKDLKIDEKTIIIFSSDNGPLYNQLGGTDADFFNSAGGFRGRKGSFYEGGFRVPCIIKWTGRVAAGTVNDRVTGFEDWLPTLLELIGESDKTPKGIDGISFAPTLLGKQQLPRPFLYRESPGYTGQQCIRVGDWKAYRANLHPNPKAKNQAGSPIELYNLAMDPKESKNVAAEHAELVTKLAAMLKEKHVPSKLWPMRVLDGE